MTNAELDTLAIEIDARAGEKMMKAVHAYLGRFVAYPSTHARDAHALWCVHAHLMEHWDATPRIAFQSPEPKSGKSRALECTAALVPRSMEAVNMSPSALFRSVAHADGLPTILFDEIDTVFGPKAKEHEDIRGLLNAGHRRGAKTYRSVLRGGKVEVEAIEAFSAVALAGLGWLPDTIRTRSIIIRMRRRHAGERVEPFRQRIHVPEGEIIRGLIERWARTAKTAWPELPPTIQDRDADVWEPLIMVADAVGGDWPQRARDAAVAFVAASGEQEASLGIQLLADTRAAFGRTVVDHLPSKSFLKMLIEIEESPWGDLRGKPLDERGLARRLREYGIRPTTIRIGDSTPRGYRRSDFVDAWGRYLPSLAERSATSKTAATILSFQGHNVADVADGVAHRQEKNTGKVNDVADVADVADFPEHSKCHHCGQGGEVRQCAFGDAEAWLHRDCEGQWIARQNADGLDIPDYLRRT